MPDLLHVDDALIVAVKPAGLLSVPGRGPDKQDCLSARIQALYPDALVVHRLDMDTSGLLCMARGIDAQRQLSIAFAERRVSKRYEALVWGYLASADEWRTINLPLIVDWPNRPKSKVDHEIGKPSQTNWRVISHDTIRNATRVELEPVTGRSHQLRVHLQALGHPIIGDPLYGPELAPEKNEGASPCGNAPRMYLHACSLTLPHPVNGEAVSFISRPEF